VKSTAWTVRRERWREEIPSICLTFTRRLLIAEVTCPLNQLPRLDLVYNQTYLQSYLKYPQPSRPTKAGACSAVEL